MLRLEIKPSPIVFEYDHTVFKWERRQYLDSILACYGNSLIVPHYPALTFRLTDTANI